MADNPRIVDMRLRPSWLHRFFGATPGTPDYEVVRWLNRRVGSRDVDHFAAAPDLPALLAEMVAVAFRNENVFVSPDMYMFSPGGRLYIEAANGFMQDQYLFGTSYPFRAMRQSVQDLGAVGLSAAVLEKVVSGNPRRLLKAAATSTSVSAGP